MLDRIGEGRFSGSFRCGEGFSRFVLGYCWGRVWERVFRVPFSVLGGFHGEEWVPTLSFTVFPEEHRSCAYVGGG